MMGFIEAVNSMTNGSKCIRQGWTGFYLCVLSGQNYIWAVSKDTANNTNSSVYVASVNDILAQDWIIKS